jgi:hypothetical protein
MFGNPEWFRKKSVGWGLRPVCWRGWIYVVVWVAVICVPFIALLASHLLPEALIWVAVTFGVLLWDVRQAMRELTSPKKESSAADASDEVLTEQAAGAARKSANTEDADDVMVIDENTEPDPAYFNTRSYDFHWRR